MEDLAFPLPKYHELLTYNVFTYSWYPLAHGFYLDVDFGVEMNSKMGVSRASSSIFSSVKNIYSLMLCSYIGSSV